MNDIPDEKLASALRRAVSPVSHAAIPSDTWPALQRMIEKDRQAFPWADAVLAAAAAAWVACFPEAISTILMHL